ncbi:hypothetical protein C8F04DRAFT_1088253 [Mycena alexandri]|uniref:Secreted protein n=1 Tax=Mycena alexandri TaxID=1745969 RepID=A0AAD6T3I6_9AGAR|nr:hypothetical protein C8F04DRAFT_1088253 [Mycena alexandri]
MAHTLIMPAFYPILVLTPSSLALLSVTLVVNDSEARRAQVQFPNLGPEYHPMPTSERTDAEMDGMTSWGLYTPPRCAHTSGLFFPTFRFLCSPSAFFPPVRLRRPLLPCTTHSTHSRYSGVLRLRGEAVSAHRGPTASAPPRRVYPLHRLPNSRHSI